MAARHLTIKFGLMVIAAQIEGAVEKPPTMSNLCQGQPGHEAHEPSPLRQPPRCDHCGDITDRGALVKGVKAGQSYTLVDPEQIADAKEEFNAQYKGAIELVPHPAKEFLTTTAAGDSIYYVTPKDVGGANHYQLLVRLIECHPELVFAGLYTPVSKTDLYMLTVRDGVLVMQKRVREQALKPAPSVGGEVNEALYAMLDGSLESFVVPYDAEAYEDRYALAVAQMIAEGEQVTVGTQAEAAAPVQMSDDELMEKLAKLRKVA